jgi:hypothetical protein
VDVRRCPATADLTAPQLEGICLALVPRAGSWTTGQLRSRLLRMILAVDPGYRARRYQAAVADRGVVGYLGPDGTAVVRGFGLSPADAPPAPSPSVSGGAQPCAVPAG